MPFLLLSSGWSAWLCIAEAPSIATATLGSSDLTESRVKQLSDEISKKIADYVVDRLSHSAHCNPCWKHQNTTGN